MPVTQEHYKMLNVLWFGYLYLKLRKKRRVRSIGVRNIFKGRIQHGDGHNLFEELRIGDAYMFFTYTRMNGERFEYLLAMVGPLIIKRKMYTVITPAQRLAMTLRFLAAGDSQDSLSFAYRCAQSTVSCILKETTQVVIAVLKRLYLAPPTSEEEWRNVASGFWNEWQFPHCIGAIDGKHIQIQAPQTSQSIFFNYKKTFSIVLLAICDAHYNFLMVDIGAEGSQSDGGIFQSSELGQRLEGKTLGIPPSNYLPGTDADMPFFLVGDAAFPLKPYLMKPYSGRELPDRDAIFNYRLSRARRVIENSFGILSARWRIFRHPICASLENTESIVESAICLHNFIMKTAGRKLQQEYCPPNFIDIELPGCNLVEGEWRDILAGENGAIIEGPRLGARNAAVRTVKYRNALRDFVNEQGAVPWQNNIVQIRQGLIL
ncbi:protein ALP1-like [Athalia rosae]|uniref:protein ALP1-like n=1 Tax=Athalia rosae TaxID=37344 RepID=UPI0020342379|nr:protein ALP1-like [Athalia rosae]